DGVGSQQHAGLVRLAESRSGQHRFGSGRRTCCGTGDARETRGGRVTLPPAQIAEAFEAACLAELDAPKPGNVHVFASGHRMSTAEFERSAAAAAAPIAAEGARVGARILNAVEATFAAVGANTNLGIILLCAPLAAAAGTGSSDLRSALEHTLAQL